MNKLVSIVVPVFNVKEFLTQCLDSIVNSDYDNLEIILIDDGSSDSSEIICDEYSRKYEYVKVVHQANAGQASARNHGIEIAQGEYLGFVDSDDYIEENMISLLVEELEKHGADIVCCRHYEDTGCRIQAKVYNKELQKLSGKEAAQKSLEDVDINTYVWDKIYRRSLFEGVRFLSGRIFEDMILLPNILLKARLVVNLPEPLYYYRIRTSSTITLLNEKRFLDKIMAVEQNITLVVKEFPDILPMLLFRNSESIRDYVEYETFMSLPIEKRKAYCHRYRECYMKTLLYSIRQKQVSVKAHIARLFLFISPRAYHYLRKIF